MQCAYVIEIVGDELNHATK